MIARIAPVALIVAGALASVAIYGWPCPECGGIAIGGLLIAIMLRPFWPTE